MSFFAIDSHSESVLKFVSFGQNQNLKISTAKAAKNAKELTANLPEHAHMGCYWFTAQIFSLLCELGYAS